MLSASNQHWGAVGVIAFVGAVLFTAAIRTPTEPSKALPAPIYDGVPINADANFGSFGAEQDKCSKLATKLLEAGLPLDIAKKFSADCRLHFQTADRHHI